jgi:RimJ/RimL family protein N-acetyltransferase
MTNVNLQPLTTDDFGLLFDWRNSPASRQFSLNAEPLAWESHVKWCRTQTTKKTPYVWIALSSGQPIGYGRLDKNGVISVFVSDSSRGHGFGPAIIRALCEIADSRNVEPTATIHNENTVSIASFKSAGFIKRSKDDLPSWWPKSSPLQARMIVENFSLYIRPDCACEEKTVQFVTASSEFGPSLGVIETSFCRACGAVWLKFVKRTSPWINKWL